MKQVSILLLFICLLISCKKVPSHAPYSYDVAENPWEERLGNHRAVLNIPSEAEAVSLSFEWRRPDKDMDKRCFYIIHAETGDTIQNILRQEVTNENCKLIFGPVKQKGMYYFYYLPYQVQPGHGFYYKGYDPPEKEPDQSWINVITKTEHLPEATILKVESRSAFDSFFPMEIIATQKEKDSYRKENKPFRLFTEDRVNPIRMKYEIPYKWLSQSQENISFKGKAMINEYYTFQLALWNGSQEINDITYTTEGLSNGKNRIPADRITCFNKEGIDPDGKAFIKELDIEPDFVQPLWFGVDIPLDQPTGKYKGIIEIKDVSGYMIPVTIELDIQGEVLADRGDSEPWRHSRLRWLNSTLGLNDEPTIGYQNITVDENQISCLGRTVSVDEQTAMPEAIYAWDNELLASPIRFIIQTSTGIKNIPMQLQSSEIKKGTADGVWTGKDEDLQLTCKARMEFDGWINYIYTIESLKDIQIKDIRLEIPLKKKHSSHFMGMGLPGQLTPKSYTGKWDTPEKTVNNYGVSIPVSIKSDWLWPFDSFWCGSQKAGIHCEVRGSSYSGPLLNLYRPAYPPSWYNEGKGGFTIQQSNGQTTATVYSGERKLSKSERLSFDFAFLITPVKEINYHSQFTDRYYHNGFDPVPTTEDVDAGVRIINVHHANYLNPYINYPFLTTDILKDFTNSWHDKGCKVKIYYTIRELTNVVPEIWALRSLGNEILADGRGGGYPWCQEHFVANYTPQWYQHLEEMEVGSGITVDASILTATGESRWYNYYIEGLAWLVKNLDIDGIYLDDVSFDRRILKRMRRAMEGVKPGCLIDLHSNTGFSRGPAIQYAEYFPYVDKVWFGESFMYDQMSPANWLVEVSGIPFGLMGDMLHGGGNRWLGMQYGMTVRHPWMSEGVVCDPRIIWKVWDDFGIQHSRMVGYWEDNPPVTTSDSDVKVTSYIKDKQTLLSIGNYSADKKDIRLSIDWKKLGLDPSNIEITAPQMHDFQEAKTFSAGEVISIEPKKGWLLIINQK